MFNEYASAVEGMLHPLDGIGNVRVPPAPMAGPPKVPAALRVSATRQGVAV